MTTREMSRMSAHAEATSVGFRQAIRLLMMSIYSSLHAFTWTAMSLLSVTKRSRSYSTHFW